MPQLLCAPIYGRIELTHVHELHHVDNNVETRMHSVEFGHEIAWNDPAEVAVLGGRRGVLR